MALGLGFSALDEIKSNSATVKKQKIQVLKYWLRGRVIEEQMRSCPPTWSQLADAVAEQSIRISDRIRRKYCGRLPL